MALQQYGMQIHKKRNEKLQEKEKKNARWTEKDKIYDNDIWNRETRANRKRDKRRKD